MIAACRPTRPARLPQAVQQGYILLFALGLMSVVATLVLSVTVTLRLDAQLLGREKSVLQEHYLLKGAANYTAVQLGITFAATALKPPISSETLNEWRLWSPNGQTFEANLENAKIQVVLEDVSGLPDANMLSQQDWERLFLLTATATPETAKGLATKVMDLREQLIRTRNTAGFTSLKELLEWKEIATAIARRRPDKNPWGLEQLLVVGTRNKQVDLNSAPLPLLQVLGNVTNEQLQRLATLRRSGPITAAQAGPWLQGTGLTALAPGASPVAVRSRMRTASVQPNGMTLTTVFANNNGEYSIVDQMMDRGTVGQ